MPKLPMLKPREVVHLLGRAGFRLVRQKGSHQIFIKGNRAVTVPIHPGDLRKGTLRAIVTQSGMSVKEFLDLR